MAFFGKGGGAAPGGAPMMSPIPMARPAANMANTAPAPGGGGLFSGMSSQARYDMAMSMLQNGMASAAQSNSPVAAFLAPLAGAVIGGKIQSKYDTAKASETDSMIAAMMPNGVSPEMQKLFDIASNENAPAFLRSTAEARIKEAMNPKKAAGGGAGGSRRPWTDRNYGNSDALMTAMLVDAYDPNGDGGANLTPAEKARIDTVKVARSRYKEGGDDYDPNLDNSGEAAGGALAPIIIDGYTIQQVN